MCFCTSVESAFAWAGAIVVNIAFLSLITWGASTFWLLGFGVCLVYTILLFGLAFWLDYSKPPSYNDDDGVFRDTIGPSYRQIRNDSNHERTNQDNENEQAAAVIRAGEPPAAIAKSERPILVSILYGLAVVSLGASGFFLPVNLLHCGDVNPPTRNDGHWVTNISALPKDIQPWAESNNIDRGDGDSFVYLPYSGVTIFQGHNSHDNKCKAAQADSSTVVWATQPYSFLHLVEPPPICFNISSPTEFTLVTDKEACFVAVPPSSPTHVRYVHCSDGKSMKQATKSSGPNLLPVDCPETPHNLVSSLDGILWYKKGYEFDERGQPIFSLDFMNMQEIIHSTFQKQNSNNNNTNSSDYGPIPKWSDEDCTSWIPRLAAIATVFASALPMVLVSILLWCKKQVPSMSITTYIGLTVMAFSIFIAVVGNYDTNSAALDNFTDWWCFSSALVGLGIMTDLFFSNQVDKKPLAWAINFLALVYVVGLAMITTRELENELWFWIALNILAFMPLGILGIAVEQILLVAMCAIGFLADAFRLASLLIDRFLSSDAQALAMPIYFVVLAITGLAIAGFGWILNKHQDELHSSLADFMQHYSVSGMILEECFYDDEVEASMLPILNQEEEQDITVPAQRHEDLT